MDEIRLLDLMTIWNHECKFISFYLDKLLIFFGEE